MIINSLKIALSYLTLALLIFQIHAAIIRQEVSNDVYGNLLNNNDVKFPASTCCVVPTCQSPSQCYQTLTCGYLCSSGKYPPAEYSKTPGYRLKESYKQYDCRFGDCRYYDFTCSHCQDPQDKVFSIYLVREDCKECYYLGSIFS